ncbi:hypothetical protein EIKCOROL_01338 [Eikenella corrodens ATCC 23834]|uniref:Uncharacterized protein n=1 Tax=Eikenella corrodens ATCC 23834 TaxID=546274 RepID=C0DVE9_EIKCO|nr:hypothetical protein EIKCOROL_01338 [Eikenella corrodens ATCC 23834]
MCLSGGNGADYRLPENSMQRSFGKMNLSGSLFNSQADIQIYK